MRTMSTLPDLSTLRDLARSSNPVASVYLGRSEGTTGPTFEHDIDLRWQVLHQRLVDLGGDQATLAAIADRMAELGRGEVALFGTAGEVPLSRVLPQLEGPDLATFGATAHLVPLLAWWQRHPGYVVVVIDRTGADLTAVRPGALAGETVDVVGPDDEIEHNAPGGWSQPRYHRRAVDSWHHNAGAVAAAAVRAVEQVDAGLLLLGGDVRAAQLFREHLPNGLRARLSLREIPGGRSADGSWAVRQSAIAEEVRRYADGVASGDLDRAVAGRGPGGTAVEGVEPTLAALAAGQVQTLLVADDPTDTRIAWFGDTTLCLDTDGVPTADRLRGAPLVDVAVRAALLTDARIQVIEPAAAGALAEGIGALCRFS